MRLVTSIGILWCILFCVFFSSSALAINNDQASKRKTVESENALREAKIHSNWQQRGFANRPSTHPTSATYARLKGISASFDFYIWRDGANLIWVEVVPVTVEDVFICSPAFLFLQDGSLYDTARLEDASEFSQCGDVTEKSIFQLTQYDFTDAKADLNEAFTLYFDGDGEVYQRIDFQGKNANPNSSVIDFFNPATNIKQRSFLYILNPSATTAIVKINAIDDRGIAASGGTVEFSLPANSATEFSSVDLEKGNATKGLQGSFGAGTGKWRLFVQSNVALDTKSILRTPQGYENDLSRVMTSKDGKFELRYVNPHSSTKPHSFLRIINPTSRSGTVKITGRDETGVAASDDIRFSLGAQESKQINSRDLEIGSTDKDLFGTLGDGTGKWHLEVESDLDIKVMMLIRTPDGFLSNFSD